MNPIKLVVQLTEARASNVKTINHDLNMIFHLQNSWSGGLPMPPSDPHFSRQWHLHHGIKHTDIDPRSSTRCLDAWRLLSSYGDPEVVIGITDDGCKLDHPDFNGQGKFADWGYWVGGDFVHSRSIGADPAQMYDCGANHGTSCAGVSAAEADAVLTVGAAPGCRLLPTRWPSNGRNLFIGSARMAKVLDFVADKIDILSNSWGRTPHTTWPRNVTDRIRRLSVSGGRRNSGILFLWAAGNDNSPIKHTGSLDIPYTDGWKRPPNARPYWHGVKTSTSFKNDLADIPGVMHVAALASTAKRSHYSNYGPGIDICAPSNNVHTYLRLYVRGLGISTTTGPRKANSAAEVTDRFGGTSSATPLVAGIAALIISANRSLTALEVKSCLERSTNRNLDFSGYPKTPPSLYNPNTSWDISPVEPYDRGYFDAQGWSPWFGYGKVNAHKAVSLARFGVATTLLTPEIIFNDVAEGEPIWRAIAWECIGFEDMTFGVVGGKGPTAPFSMLNNREQVTIQEPGVDAPTRAWLWLAYTGTKSGDVASDTITVGCAETGEEWELQISANVIKRPTVGVALILDKSGSMSWACDSDKARDDVPRRVDVLRDASWNFVNLAKPETGIGVVRFNDKAPAELALPLIPLGAGISDQARKEVRDTIGKVRPGGRTSIGNGINVGDLLLKEAGGYESTAMIVVTDGQENSKEYIKDVLPHIDRKNNIYAIGLGEPHVVDPEKLELLTGRANGYVVLTGVLTRDSDLILSKYYSQILADVSNQEIVLDPEGLLTKDGPEKLFHFDITSLDFSVDVILITTKNVASEVVHLDLIPPDACARPITPAELHMGWNTT